MSTLIDNRFMDMEETMVEDTMEEEITVVATTVEGIMEEEVLAVD